MLPIASAQPSTSRPVVSIVGPTATGKSGFAFWLAERLLAEGHFATIALISADSRQVYRGLEIVSGADIPPEFEEVATSELDGSLPHFLKKTPFGDVQLFGVSMIEPTTEWSLAAFQQFALAAIEQTWQHGGLPIVLGGTGLYHRRLFAEELQLLPGPSAKLRSEWMNQPLAALQHAVKLQFPEAFAQMTIDDQHNSRRLIRVLEKQNVGDLNDTDSKNSQSGKNDNQLPHTFVAPDTFTAPTMHLTIGLTDSIEQIERRITNRVEERIALGAIQEVSALASHVNDRSLAVFSATGVKEIMDFQQEKMSLAECKERWVRRERQYAKRQLTWWKKHNEGSWFNVSDEDSDLSVTSRTVAWQEQAYQQLLASL